MAVWEGAGVEGRGRGEFAAEVERAELVEIAHRRAVVSKANHPRASDCRRVVRGVAKGTRTLDLQIHNLAF